MIETLEPRVAPATLLSPTTVTYEDIDGDLIKVKLTKPILTEANVATLFIFNNAFESPGPQSLQTIEFAGLPTDTNGIGISVTAKRSAPAGDGAVFIFAINASNDFGAGIDLGKVNVQGEIARIDAGDPDNGTTGLQSLKVHAFGASGPSERSYVYGNIGTVTVRGNFGGELFSEASSDLPSIGKLTIGGSLIPPDGVAGASISGGNGIGSVVVKGNIVGGTAPNSGQLFAFPAMRSLTVNGSVIGGSGEGSGSVQAISISSVKIGGSIIGGDGPTSGVVNGYGGGIAKMVVGGSLIGGIGINSGQIHTGGFAGFRSDIGSLLIKGSIIGVANVTNLEGFGTGLNVLGSIHRLTVLGDLVRANISVGIDPGPNDQFGDADDFDNLDPNGICVIAKLVIKGSVYGSATPGDSFAIQANKILSVKIGQAIYKNTDPSLNFATGVQLAPHTGDVVLREVN